MFLKFYLIYITIIILRHILYSIHLWPGPGQFMSYLCDLFFIFSITLIVINHITSLKQTHLCFVHFSECLLFSWMITWMKKANKFQITKAQRHGLATFSNFFAKING